MGPKVSDEDKRIARNLKQNLQNAMNNNLAKRAERNQKIALKKLENGKVDQRKNRPKDPNSRTRFKTEGQKEHDKTTRQQRNKIKKLEYDNRTVFERAMATVMLVVAMYLPLQNQLALFCVSKVVFGSFSEAAIQFHAKQVLELAMRRRYIDLVNDSVMFNTLFSSLGLRWTTLWEIRGGRCYPKEFSRSNFLRFFKIGEHEAYCFSSKVGDTSHALTEEFIGRIGLFTLDFNSVADNNELVRRKTYWGIVGPYLPATNEFVVKYTDMQCIRWKATKELIYDFLYADDRRGVVR